LLSNINIVKILYNGSIKNGRVWAMNITTIIELDNQEVEEMAGAELVFIQEQIEENIIETCVDCFKIVESGKCMPTEEAMEKVFEQLKKKGVIPEEIEDFSYQTPSCERLKCNSGHKDLPQKVIISFMS
jgi:hypothetical protein